jgi:flagellar biosynthesis/type III secretory pathway chaperone
MIAIMSLLEISAASAAGRPIDWEADLSAFLAELTGTQEELLDVLHEKRQRLAVADVAGLSSLQTREAELSRRLEQCQVRRAELLARAERAGLPGDSIGKLAAAVPAPGRENLGKQVKHSAAKMRLLQHQSLTNWVLAQRALLHVSQLLEIIATGGRMQPTYGDRESLHGRGTLVNQEA